jgi:hypothetical protein
MARVWLQAAWSMARVCLKAGRSMAKVTKNPTHFSNEREKVFVNDDYQAIILR